MAFTAYYLGCHILNGATKTVGLVLQILLGKAEIRHANMTVYVKQEAKIWKKLKFPAFFNAYDQIWPFCDHFWPILTVSEVNCHFIESKKYFESIYFSGLRSL